MMPLPMKISPGVKLGPYEIVTAIGAGGMGEVYKALDTRLERTVAVKAVSGMLDATSDARDRFRRRGVRPPSGRAMAASCFTASGGN